MYMRTKTILIFILLLLNMLGIAASEAESKHAEKTHIVVAKLETPVLKLYFSGVLDPIQTLPVVSPVAGNIVVMNFTYGDRVKNNQLLFEVTSSELASYYRKAINDYLQK